MFEWLTDWFRKDSSNPPAINEETFEAIARLPELRESHTGADFSLRIEDQGCLVGQGKASWPSFT